MSFRELRNFTEMMRALGYSRPISIENFRNPNFELVLDILHWLVKRYEPSADLPTPAEVHNMQDRVIVLKQAAQLMAAKGRIKLNTKRLYQADGYAVKELLKLSQVLYSAMRSNPEEDDEMLGSDSFTLKVTDLKDIRDLASEITEHGAIVSELLAKEDSLREARQRAISRDLEMTDVEKMVRASIQAAEENIKYKEQTMADLETDRAKLESKIKKKQEELERNEKRLRSLQTVRPAFMDEYEKLEEELHDLYRDYLERFRNLDYLEFQLEQHNRKEQERIEQNERQMKRMQDKLKEDELKVLRGDVQVRPPRNKCSSAPTVRPLTCKEAFLNTSFLPGEKPRHPPARCASPPTASHPPPPARDAAVAAMTAGVAGR